MKKICIVEVFRANVLKLKNTSNSENHWVVSFTVYAFHTTTVFQSGIYELICTYFNYYFYIVR